MINVYEIEKDILVVHFQLFDIQILFFIDRRSNHVAGQ